MSHSVFVKITVSHVTLANSPWHTKQNKNPVFPCLGLNFIHWVCPLIFTFNCLLLISISRCWVLRVKVVESVCAVTFLIFLYYPIITLSLLSFIILLLENWKVTILLAHNGVVVFTPICFHTTTLSGPIISIPYRTAYTHWSHPLGTYTFFSLSLNDLSHCAYLKITCPRWSLIIIIIIITLSGLLNLGTTWYTITMCVCSRACGYSQLLSRYTMLKEVEQSRAYKYLSGLICRWFVTTCSNVRLDCQMIWFVNY